MSASSTIVRVPALQHRIHSSVYSTLKLNPKPQSQDSETTLLVPGKTREHILLDGTLLRHNHQFTDRTSFIFLPDKPILRDSLAEGSSVKEVKFTAFTVDRTESGLFNKTEGTTGTMTRLGPDSEYKWLFSSTEINLPVNVTEGQFYLSKGGYEGLKFQREIITIEKGTETTTLFQYFDGVLIPDFSRRSTTASDQVISSVESWLNSTIGSKQVRAGAAAA